MIFARNNSKKALFASLLSFVSTINEGFYRGPNERCGFPNNYSHDINEIRADYRSMCRTRDFVEDNVYPYPSKVADKIMLEIVEDKIIETSGFYCVCIDCKEPIRSWSEYTEAAEHSAERAYEIPFGYNISKFKDIDDLAHHMYYETESGMVDSCLNESNAFKQLYKLAILNNQLDFVHPEDTYHITP